MIDDFADDKFEHAYSISSLIRIIETRYHSRLTISFTQLRVSFRT